MSRAREREKVKIDSSDTYCCGFRYTVSFGHIELALRSVSVSDLQFNSLQALDSSQDKKGTFRYLLGLLNKRSQFKEIEEYVYRADKVYDRCEF